MEHGLLIGQYENVDNGLDVVSLERDYLDGFQVDMICLTWSGDTFTAKESPDGSNWTTIGTVQVQMNTDVLAGVVGASNSPGVTSTDAFDNAVVQ